MGAKRNQQWTKRGHKNEKDLEPVSTGSRVELCNLRSAAHLNGERAIVMGVDAANGRYEIRLEMDNSTKQVKRENFKPFLK